MSDPAAVAPSVPVEPSVPRRTGFRRWLPTILTVLVVAVAFGFASWIAIDPVRVQQVRELLASPVGLLALFGLNVLANATLVLPVPGLALTGFAATVADPLVVGVVAGAGQTVGELTGYLVGYTGRKVIADHARSQRLAGWMERWGALILFVLALLPNPFFDIAGILAGAARMPLRVYLAAAGAGKILKNLALAYGVGLGIDWLFGGTP